MLPDYEKLGHQIRQLSSSDPKFAEKVEELIKAEQGLSAGCKKLGTATTIGELKKLIENFDDNTSFGFRNQPMQDLYEINYEDFRAIVFQ